MHIQRGTFRSFLEIPKREYFRQAREQQSPTIKQLQQKQTEFFNIRFKILNKQKANSGGKSLLRSVELKHNLDISHIPSPIVEIESVENGARRMRFTNSKKTKDFNIEQAENFVTIKFSKLSINVKTNTYLFDDKISEDEKIGKGRELQYRAKAFKRGLHGALKQGITIEDKVKEVEKFLYHGNGGNSTGIDRFSADELQQIYKTFWGLGAYDLMVEMMHECNNPWFKCDPVNMQFYALANMRSNYFNPSIVNAVANYLLEIDPKNSEALALQANVAVLARDAAKILLNALEHGEKLKKQDIKNYLKFFSENDIHNKKLIKANADYSHDRAIRLYQDAYLIGFNSHYGREVVLFMSEKQPHPKDFNLFIKSTTLSVEKDGGIHSVDRAVLTTHLLMIYANKNVDPHIIKNAQDALFIRCHSKSEFLTVINALDDLHIDSPSKDKFRDDLVAHCNLIENNPEEAAKHSRELKHDFLKNQEHWEAKSFDFKSFTAISILVLGNFKFGGVLPSHLVNQSDREFFLKLLNTPLNELLSSLPNNAPKSLQEIEDFDEFNKYVDLIIREKFYTDQLSLERLDSEGHKKFDEDVGKYQALCGARTSEERKEIENSATNVSSCFAIGLGDCRHQSQAKQLLNDLWLSAHLNAKIQDFHYAYQINDKKGMLLAEAEFKDMADRRVKTTDVEIFLPVKMGPNGKPVWHNGHLVKGDKYVKVEEHTLNILLENNGKETSLIDVFYQHTYPFGNNKLAPLGRRFVEGLAAGSCKMWNEQTERYDSADIFIKPARHAGSDKQEYIHSIDHNTYFNGIQTDLKSLVEEGNRRDKAFMEFRS